MNDNIDDARKRTALAKILQNSEFVRSETYQRLLQYLFECSIHGEIPKESTISLEFFNKKQDFDATNDTTVRYHMYQLRQKLKKYYNEEGKNADIKLSIPKGHYEVKFYDYTQNSQKRRIIPSYKPGKIEIILFMLLLLMIGLYVLKTLQLERRRDGDIRSNNFLWSDFLAAGDNPIIVLGDHFFYREYQASLKRWRFIRDFSINDGEAFDSFKKKYENKNLQLNETGVVYFSTSNVWPLPSILRIFAVNDATPTLLQRSQLLPTHYVEQNMIFLGNIVTLGHFGQFLKQTSFEINTEGVRQIILHRPDGDEFFSVNTLGSIWHYHKDYVIVVKTKGLGRNTILIIADFLGSGAKTAAEYLTSPQKLIELATALDSLDSKQPAFFELLFEVECFRQKTYQLKLLYAKLLKIDEPRN